MRTLPPALARIGAPVVSLFLALVVGSLIAPQTAEALEPLPGEEIFEALEEARGERSSSGGASMGVSLIDGKTYLAIAPMFDLSLGPFGVGLWVPLNIEVPDGGLRDEDYDEPYDYLRIIRYVRYARKGAPLYARAGELAARIGHGTIVNRYMNNIDLNSFHLGLQMDVNTKWGGVETLFSDVGRLVGGSRSGVNGARIYVKPWSFIDPDSPLNIFNTGLSVISDSDAPTKLAAGTDDGGWPNVDTTKAATVIGLDADVELVRMDIINVTPYTDLNFLGHGGWGWHLGTMATLKLPFGLTIPAQVEYRLFRNDYLPTYFGNRYELERWVFGCSEGEPSSVPKSQCVNQLDDDGFLHGYSADIAFDLLGLVHLRSVIEAYQGHDATFLVFLAVPALQVLQFRASYERVGVTGTDDLFAFDDRSRAIGQARYQLMAYLYLVGQLKREWVYVPDETVPDETVPTTGEFEPKDTTYVGLELSFDF